jgi:hypothetical protein
MGRREALVCSAGFEVTHEARHDWFLLTTLVGSDAGDKLAGNGLLDA